MTRLVVVSNRVALPRSGSSGGLASALQAALEENGGLWFGWSGKATDEPSYEVRRETAGNITFATLDLSRRDMDEYYAGFANRVLWPLFHYRADLINYEREDYAGYLRVNRLFAAKLGELLEPDDLIWVHDYHLIPLAESLRGLGVNNRIGFFLHTPFPACEVATALPKHRRLFGAFAAYDLVGFHTEDHLRAFQDYFMQESGSWLEVDGWLRLRDGQRFRACAFPISIDTAGVARQAGAAEELPAIRRLRNSLGRRALVIGVDRIDYSKGLAERFQAFSLFLELHPEHRAKITLLQIAQPSRSDVPEYDEIRQQLDYLAGSINGRYANPEWMPIRYVNKSYRQSTLTGFYRLGRIGLVTPFRDGMNLVAKEYVASQNPEDPGVLVLSRFAGAVHELTAALIVNPYDTDEVADAILQALTMPLAERRERWESMMAVLREHDITAWRKSFLAALAGGA